jgi:putative peptidoglycan lipid II flippase
MVFAFVPMLTAAEGEQRTALFLKLRRSFAWVFSGVAMTVALGAPWLMRAFAPGLNPQSFATAVSLMRILAFSTMAAGMGAVSCALLYTYRRFGPTAYYQAALNACTVICALSLWKWLGVYAFAVGYTAGAWVQLGVVHFAARSGLDARRAPKCEIHWRELLAKPAFFVVYAASLGLNLTFTRAYATHGGSGMAAALDYCARGVSVPMSLLVTPVSNSLLPEIARLRSLFRLREAYRLIDKTVVIAALVAVGGCGFAILFRHPAIALFFQRGSFTAESTQLVAAVFLGLAGSVIGWSLIEITSRSLFALDRPWPPVIAAAIPLAFNVTFTLWLHSWRPEFIGLGSTLGLLLGFVALWTMSVATRRPEKADH